MAGKSKQTILSGAQLRAEVQPLLEELGKTDRERLELLLRLSIGDKLRVSECLAALFPDHDERKATTLFRNFRAVFNKVAKALETSLRFVIDTNKQTPAAARFCWFSGTIPIDKSAEELSWAGVGAAPPGEILNPGIGTTTSAAFAGKRTFRVFICYPRATKTAVRELLGHLKGFWAMSPDFHFEPWGDWDVVAGEGWHSEIQTRLQQADVALLFLSKEFFESRYIWDEEAPKIIGPECKKPCVPVAMGQMDMNLLDLRGLEQQQIFRLCEERDNTQRSYNQCPTPRLKEAFAHELHRQMESYLRRTFVDPDADATMVSAVSKGSTPAFPLRESRDRTGRKKSQHEFFTALVADGGDGEDPGQRYYVDSLGHPISLDALRDKATTIRPQDGGMTALAFLESWAVNPEESPFCAVLGEYGVGKTTTLKQLTHRLLKARAEQAELFSSLRRGGPGGSAPSVPSESHAQPAPPRSPSSILDPPSSSFPLPIYIDLRSYVHADDTTAERLPTLREILAVILARQPRLPYETALTPDDILTLVREEGALIIFDGLDEKIVHLTARQSQGFIRELWGALPSKKQFPNRGKMILSCRSHYFPDVRSQQALLTGEDRDDKSADDYRACLVLPFTERQIRQYLENVLGADRVEPAMELFCAVHNLRELAERPYLLSIIASRKQIEKLERKRAAGQTVRATDLYAELAASWLHRDDGKHVFSLDEKQRLMEELAAALTNSGEREWPWDKLEKWLVEFLKHDETAAYRHEKDPHELLEQDLRTASFILRPDTGGIERLNHFRFAHTSLQEYFLACHLARALKENRPERWDLPAVSQETLDFLGQLLAASVADAASIGAHHVSSATAPGHRAADPSLETLNQILAGNCLAAAVLAFRYWLHALAGKPPALAKGDIPIPPLRKGGPGGAAPLVQNAGQAGSGAPPALTKGGLASPSSTSLKGYPLPAPAHVNLAGADLEELRIEGRSADNPFRLRGANLSGTKLNRSRLKHVDLTDADLTNLEARQALFQDVVATNANLTHADLCGLLWRGGSLAGAKLPDTQLAGVQWIQVDLTNADLPENWSQQATAVTFMPPEWAFATVAPSTEVGTLTSILGHANVVPGCDISPDGRLIVSGSLDNTIKIWDAESGACLMTLEGHTDSVVACTFSPDGRRILSGSWDKTVRVWDAQNGACLMTLEGHSYGVNTCAFSPDCQRIVSGSEDKTLKVWDAESGACLVTARGHSRPVVACVFGREGRQIISRSMDKSLKVWDTESGACLETRKGHTDSVNACAFSPDGKRLAAGSQDHTLEVLDAHTGVRLMTLDGHAKSVSACTFSPDGRRILSGSWDSTVKVWDAESGVCLLTLEGDSICVLARASSRDGQRIVLGLDDDTLEVWHAESGACLLTLDGNAGSVNASAPSLDGQQIVCGLRDGTLNIWDTRTAACMLTLSGHGSSVQGCSFSPEGRRIVSASWDHTLKVWNAQTGACLLTLEEHGGWVSGCAFSPDGQRIVSASFDHTLDVWDAESGACLFTLEGHANAVTACAFSSDGRRILSASGDATLKVWDAESGACLRTLRGHTRSVTACGFSPDGRHLLSGSTDTTIKVWDAETGACVMTLEGHSNSVKTCVFSPDGRWILSGSSDNTIKFWDATTGKCLWTGLLLPEHQWAAVDFEGNRILAASPEAWRFLGWRITDPRSGRLRILPAEYYGPLPTGRELPATNSK